MQAVSLASPAIRPTGIILENQFYGQAKSQGGNRFMTESALASRHRQEMDNISWAPSMDSSTTEEEIIVRTTGTAYGGRGRGSSFQHGPRTFRRESDLSEDFWSEDAGMTFA